MYYPEILVRMPMMNKVQFLFASEPCKPFKTGPLYMIFLIEKNVRVERHSDQPQGEVLQPDPTNACGGQHNRKADHVEKRDPRSDDDKRRKCGA